MNTGATIEPLPDYMVIQTCATFQGKRTRTSELIASPFLVEKTQQLIQTLVSTDATHKHKDLLCIFFLQNKLIVQAIKHVNNIVTLKQPCKLSCSIFFGHEWCFCASALFFHIAQWCISFIAN